MCVFLSRLSCQCCFLTKKKIGNLQHFLFLGLSALSRFWAERKGGWLRREGGELEGWDGSNRLIALAGSLGAAWLHSLSCQGGFLAQIAPKISGDNKSLAAMSRRGCLCFVFPGDWDPFPLHVRLPRLHPPVWPLAPIQCRGYVRLSTFTDSHPWCHWALGPCLDVWGQTRSVCV